MYLDYDTYVAYGGTLNELAFEEYEFEAGSLINYYTFNRLTSDDFDSQPDRTQYAVTRCEYALIKLIAQKDSYLNGGAIEGDANISATAIASESNDGVSVSYNVMSAANAVEVLDDKVHSLISQYLNGCVNSLGYNLLFRGLYPNE